MDKATLTFLYTDIEGSTKRWERQPGEMRAAVERQDRIVRAAIEANDGRVFRTAGDALCAVFNTAPNALLAAVAAQQALFAEPWDLDEPLRVRIVLHTGEAEPSGGDYVGGSLNRLGRMLGVCHGGQVLVSMATEQLVRDRLPPGVSLLDLGQHRFRDLIHPDRIFQVVAAGLPDRFPPLASLDSTPNNLPIQLTTFIGRQAELAETLRLLSENRLITLSGPGGTGKTRLAIQTAAEALDHSSFPDGAWLVELAPVSSPDLVLPTIASVLNVRGSIENPLQSAVSDFLRAKTILLILDNCEQFIEACSQVAEMLLQAGAGVKVIASSREPLGILGESIMRVPSLTLPATGASMDEISQNEAVQMFVERAKAVKHGFALTQQNAAAVIQICRRLDGIPLAIELAAARVALFSPAGIASRLDDRFQLLTSGSRSAVHRQQTLEALLDWSYDLLTPNEQRLFQAVSVFSGGFTFEAAEAVHGGDVLDLLAQLVNKSLVLAEETDAEESDTRYRLLDTIRQYAQRKLAASSEKETYLDRHLEYFARFSRELDARLESAGRIWWVQHIQGERDNMRSAIERGLEISPDTALEMVGKTAYYWGEYGYAAEGLRWLVIGIDRSIGLANETGNDSLQHRSILAQAYWAIAVMLGTLGDVPRLIMALEESIRLWREVGDQPGLGRSLTMIGFWGSFLGFPNRYRSQAEEGIAIARNTGNHDILANGLAALGRESLIYQKDFEASKAYFEEALHEMRQLGEDFFTGLAMISLGFIAEFQEDFETARSRFQEGNKFFQKYGDIHYTNITRSGLADIARKEKDFSKSIELYLETLAHWQEMGNLGAVARCLECLAFIAVESAQASPPFEQEHFLQHAAALFGAAEALRESSGAQMNQEEREEYEQNVSVVKAMDNQKLINESWQQGLEMHIDQAKAMGEELFSMASRQTQPG